MNRINWIYSAHSARGPITEPVVGFAQGLPTNQTMDPMCPLLSTNTLMDWTARSLTLQREDFDSSPSPDEMAVPAPAKAARALAATAAALVLLWCVHFRGGLALSSPTNKGLIFNVRKNQQPPLLPSFPLMDRGCVISSWGRDAWSLVR